MKKSLIISIGALLACMISSPAFADGAGIKVPGAHPAYRFELEPMALVAPFDEFHPGFGFRGTVVIVDNGFIKTLNNSIGIGVGGDWTSNHFRLPVVMQWNFFLHRHWAVFGEPGAVVEFGDNTKVHPAFYAGGRYYFSDRISLTMRIGHPTASVGVSFML